MSKPLVIAQERVALRDPHDCTDQSDDLAFLEAIFDALARRGADGRFRPAIAESWTVSEDARVWTFRLKPDLRFHNGDALDAAAAAFSIRRMQRPDIGATLGAPGVWRQYLADAEIVALDDLTLRISLQTPMADLLDILVSGYVLPPELADRADFLENPVGSGAYRVVEISGDEIRMAANPDWQGGKAAHAEIVWRRTPSAQDRLTAVQSGAAHLATRLEPGQASDGAVEYTDPVSIIFLFNCQRGPFMDVRVRRALNMALDREALIGESLDGAGVSLTGPVSAGHFGAASIGDDGPDIVGARRLLADAGYENGLAIVVDRPTSLPDEAERLTNALAIQLAAISVSCAILVHEDRVAYAEMVREKNIGDMCLFDSSPMSFFRVIYEKLDSRRAGAWWQGFADAEVELLLDQARRTLDDSTRAAKYEEAYRRLMEASPWLYLYNRTRAVAFDKDRLAEKNVQTAVRIDGVLDVALL